MRGSFYLEFLYMGHPNANVPLTVFVFKALRLEKSSPKTLTPIFVTAVPLRIRNYKNSHEMLCFKAREHTGQRQKGTVRAKVWGGGRQARTSIPGKAQRLRSSLATTMTATTPSLRLPTFLPSSFSIWALIPFTFHERTRSWGVYGCNGRGLLVACLST